MIPAPGAGIADLYRMVGVAIGPCRPMVGMRGSGADATPCRQHGSQGACHECVSKDTAVTRYAVMFQYEFLSLGAFFGGALFLVWPAQHPCLQRFARCQACRRCTGR